MCHLCDIINEKVSQKEKNKWNLDALTVVLPKNN
jgi:hypothetical protein